MIIDDIAITLETKVNLKTVAHLINSMGGAEKIYAATEAQIITQTEVKPEIAQQITQKSKHKAALEQLRYINNHKITAIASTDPLYPQPLREICDFPHVIYALGNAEILNRPMVAMVGTRERSEYGIKACDSIIKALAQINPNIVIVSGLAYGIDAECHRAALRYGLKTIGVVVDHLPEVSPAGHRALAQEIVAKGGCIISEANFMTKSHKGEYPQRNRIMAGMCMGTVVVEALFNGGSIGTAYLAQSYDRYVMAVPGRITDSASKGTNRLIKSEVARMVTSAEDIANELGWNIPERAQELEQKIELEGAAQQVYDCFKKGEVLYVDQIIDRTQLPANIVGATLTELELFHGAITALPGSRYELKHN